MKCSLSLSFLPSRLEGNERATHLVGSRFRDRFGHISINPPPSPCTQPPPPSQPPTTSYERARARDNSRPCLFWWPLFSFFRTHFSFLNYKLEPNYGLRPPCPPPWRPPFYSNPQLTVSFCASFSFASFLFGPRLVAAPYSWPSTETV